MKYKCAKWIASSLFLAMTIAAPAQAAEKTPFELQGVGLVERLGAQISLDLPFQDEVGKKVSLKNFVNGQKPVVLILAYYECPNLCGLLLNGATAGFRKLAWKIGEQYDVVVVSIDPKEGWHLAAQKREALKIGGHFLVGEEKNIKQLASEVGFFYHYDNEAKQYAHAAGIFILTPQGKLARALHGIEFSARDLKLALLEASEGKIGTVVDQLFLYCFRYDSTNKRYVLASNLMKGAGAATVLILGTFIFRLGRKKR